MSNFDANLFGRIAVLNNYISKQELEECLEIQHSTSSQEHIGHILLAQNYLTEEQFNRIVEIRNKKVRKLLRSQEDYVENDRDFGRLMIQERIVDLNELEAAVLEQQRLRRFNLHFSLVEVVYSRRQIGLDDAKTLLALQGCSAMRCAVCDVQYQIVDMREEEPYYCPKCRSPLEAPAFLDPLLVEGVIDASGVEPVGEVGIGGINR